MKILLAADGSDYTKRAAKHLARHRDWFTSAEIHLLHVRPPLPFPGAAAAVGKKAIEDYERTQAREALAVAEKALRKAGVAFASSWVVGDVCEEIARYAKKRDIDLIVVGSHGHGALKNLALGSVATKLIATTSVPIMVVR